jgi:hypothetical protein
MQTDGAFIIIVAVCFWEGGEEFEERGVGSWWLFVVVVSFSKPMQL